MKKDNKKLKFRILDKIPPHDLKYKQRGNKNLAKISTFTTKKREDRKVAVSQISPKKKMGSKWFIVSPNGSIIQVKDFDFSGLRDLEVFFRYENEGSREIKEAPAHVKMMQRLELVDYEPAADPGNFRWLPKGHLMKRLMEQHASELVRNYGGMQVESPVMYDLKHPQLARYLKRFPARQYRLLSGDKKYFLRFAACFGQYLIMHDMQISHHHLPLRLYELTHYSFRREQAGELAGLRRLRGFTMPDMHTLCLDIEQAKEEFRQQYLLSRRWMQDLELDHLMAIRVVEDFFDRNRDFILGIVEDFGSPVLLEIWRERLYYFILKFEFNVVDAQKKAAALSTVQIDVENAERFDIQYADRDGKPQYPLLLHTSVSGSIDRNLYALLEQQARKIREGESASFPYWLSPVQVRLIPVADRHIPHCVSVAAKLRARIEIDDRNETMPWKIRDAEINWIPLIGVIGDKEIGDDTVSIRERGIPRQKEVKIAELQKRLRELQSKKPFESMSWPNLLSKQPHFR